MRPTSILCLLFVLNGCRAGIQIHNPQTLQETNNLFNWVKNIISSSGETTYMVDREYYVTNMVTMCPLNVMFVLDGSDSVSPNGFELARSALVREIERVYNAFANTDIGVIMFSDTTMENSVLKLQTRTPAELQGLIQEVRSLKQPRRKTALPLAVKRARQELLDYSMSNGRLAYDGYRGGGLMVLITDGVPDNQRATIQEAKLASDNHIIIISVSIENANQDLLRDISNVVVEYRTPIDWSSSVACPATVLPPVKQLQDCNDFLLITDGSDSVLRYQETVRQFLAYTALRYRYLTNRIGVKLFATDSSAQKRETMIRLMDDKFALAEAIRQKLVFPKSGGTGTDIALNQAVKMLKDDPRTSTRRTSLILITDGPPLNPDSVRQAIQNAVNNNFQVVIIRVGTDLTDEMLQRMAGSGNSVYSVSDFTGLYSVDFSREICIGDRPLSCSEPKIRGPNGNCVCPNQCSGEARQDDQCRCQCINANKIYSAGSCICRQTGPCGFNQVRNPQTCQCGTTTCNKQCPAYSSLNAQCNCVCDAGRVMQGNQCVCNTNCPSDATLNNFDCGCQCINANKIYSRGTCICRNTVTCRANEQIDPQTCQCRAIPCTINCPALATRTPQCTCQCNNGREMRNNQCVCPRTCPSDAIQNANCGCQCRNTNKIYNQNACVCRTNINCVVGQQLDPQTCQCRALPCTINCPTFATRTPQCTCQCNNGRVMRNNQCVCPRACPSDAIQNANCGCQCRNTNKIYNQNACVCRTNINCVVGQQLDPQTCQCRALPCTINCPTFATRTPQCTCQCNNGREMRNNQCVCPRTCPSDAIQNANCGCQCRNTNKIYNQNACVCRTNINCVVGQQLDPQTCQCRALPCTINCPTFATRTPQCTCQCNNGREMRNNQCVCPRTCPSDAIQNANCGCQCRNTNKIYNQNACVCRTNINCVVGQQLDPQTCQCRALPCTINCPTFATRTPQCTCQCNNGREMRNNQCVCPRTCPSDAIQNANCGCQCKNTNKIYNQNACVCRTNINCVVGQQLDPQTCQCRALPCTINCPTFATRTPQCTCQCNNGREMRNNQCVCPRTCPSDAIQNANCGCQCRKTNKIYNQNACVCRTNINCGVREQLDPQTCQCRALPCTINCPAFATRTPQCTCQCNNGREMRNNQCVCPRTCPSDAIQNANCGCQCRNTNKIYNQNACVCRTNINCGVREQLDPQTCQCRALPCTINCPAFATRTPQCTCQCNNGREMRNNQCVCPRTCPSDAIQNANCGCQCRNTNKIYNQNACVCRTNINCGVREQLDPQTCQCRALPCTINCPTFATRTPQCTCQCNNGREMRNNQCVCPRTCPSDAIQNANCGCQCRNTNKIYNQNACVCRTNINCGVREQLDPQTCQCRALPCTINCPAFATRTPQCTCQCNNGREMRNSQCVCPRTCPSDAIQNANCGCQCRNTNKIYNQNACVCRTNINCGVREQLDPQTCQCRALPCTINCPAFATRTPQCTCQCNNGREMRNNQCVCPRTCPSDAIQNANCGCQCRNTNKIYNQNACVCRTNINCGVREQLDPQTCQCRALPCTINCPAFATRTPQCTCQCNNGREMRNNQCVCPRTCPSEAIQNANCGCQCRNTNKIYNQNACVCRTNINCGVREQLDPQTCQCRALPCTINCPAFATRTPQCTCQCNNGREMRNNQCVCPRTCPSDAIQNANCGCQCRNTNMIYNQNACVCRTNINCGVREQLDPQTCQCRALPCTINCPAFATRTPQCTCQCNNGREMRNNQCVCPRTCPSDAIQNANCGCQCRNTNKIYNQNACVCRTNINCGVREQLDPQTCQCRALPCTINCPAFATRTPQCTCQCNNGREMRNNQCVCPKTCPSDAIQNANCGCQCRNTNKIYNQNACVCRTNINCGVREQLDPQTCQCRALPCTINCPAFATRTPQCTCQCNNGREMRNNQCVCPRTCPSDAIQNANCGCQCRNTNKIYNQNACVCRTNINCGVREQLDPQTCQCRALPCTINCPAFATRTPQCTCQCNNGREMRNNQCVCPKTCPSDAIQNANCGCQCRNTNKIYNQNACVCRTNINCGVREQLDPQTCQCRALPCTINCPAFATRTPQCTCQCNNGREMRNNQCVCPRTCPSDAIQNANCGCQCRNTNKIYNQNACVCRTNINCGVREQLDPQTCQCRALPCTINCPAFATRTPQCTCQCNNGREMRNNQCVCPRTCPSDAIQNANCGCQCRNTNKIYNQNACVCRTNINCGVREQLDPQTCQCRALPCTINCPAFATRTPQCTCQCNNGREMRNKQCVCPRTCPSDAIQNANCGCQCRNTNMIYNQNACVCRTNINCGVREQLDPQTCQCRALPCTINCPAFATRTPQCTCQCNNGREMRNNQCVCPRTCPSDAIQNANCGCQCRNTNKIYNQNACVCRTNINCGVGQQLDPQTCQCRALPCTINCPTFATRTPQCTCQCNNGREMRNNQCVCAARNCGFNQVMNPQTCQCAPRQCNIQCPVNSVRTATCTCQCNAGRVMQNRQCVCAARNCGINQVINPQTCQCAPRQCNIQCPVNSVRTATCTCQCNAGRVMQNRQCVCAPRNCGINQVMNPQTCQCAPRQCNIQCPVNSVRTATCTCQCNAGRVMQNRQCVCAPRNCGINQIMNPQTCQCAPRQCNIQCPVNSVRTATCTCQCNAGLVMQNRQCVPSTQNSCPGLNCLNGQPSIRDCEGNCYCSCGPGFAGDQCEIKLSAELCNDCEYSNGQYLAGVKGSCQLFVTCLPANGEPADGRIRPSAFTPVLKTCAQGTLYLTRSNGWRGCDYAGNGVCEQEICATLPSFANYTDHDSCRSYWSCGGDKRTSGRRCCPPGTGFDSRIGQCTPSTTCTQRCPWEVPNCSGTVPGTGCNIGRNPNNFNQWFYLNKPNERFNCNSGMVMDLTLCTCVNGDGVVTAKPPTKCLPSVFMDFERVAPREFSRIVRTQVQGHPGYVADLVTTPDLDIIFKQFSGSGFYTPYFEIDVKIKVEGQVSGNGKTAVVTNADCNVDDSVSITMDRQNFYFRVSLEGTAQPVVISIPYAGKQDADGFYSLKLVYVRGRTFSGTVGTFTETYSGPLTLNGVIGYRKCAVHLGRGFGYERFVGYVDDLSIWRCNPKP